MTEIDEDVKPSPRQPREIGQQRVHVAGWVNIQLVGELAKKAKTEDISTSYLVANALTHDAIIAAAERAPRTKSEFAPRQPRRYDHERMHVGGRVTPEIHEFLREAAKLTHTSISGIVSQVLADMTGIEP